MGKRGCRKGGKRVLGGGQEAAGGPQRAVGGSRDGEEYWWQCRNNPSVGKAGLGGLWEKWGTWHPSLDSHYMGMA